MSFCARFVPFTEFKQTESLNDVQRLCTCAFSGLPSASTWQKKLIYLKDNGLHTKELHGLELSFPKHSEWTWKREARHGHPHDSWRAPHASAPCRNRQSASHLHESCYPKKTTFFNNSSAKFSKTFCNSLYLCRLTFINLLKVVQNIFSMK